MQVLTRENGFVQREMRGTSTWNPAMQWGSTSPPTNGQAGGISASGTTMSEQHALQLAAAWGSVSVIADAISTLEVTQWRMVSGEPVRMDCAPVIVQPWPELTQREFIGQGSVSMLVRGNLFGQITDRDPDTLFPSQVQLVHPDHAKIRRDGQTGQIQTYYWNKLVADPNNVTRARGLSVPEGLVGLNPVEYLRNTLGLARAQDLMSGSFFANSARPDGVLQVDGDLDPEETVAMLKSWQQSHQGIGNAYLPAVLTGGAKWQAITMPLADAQFLEQMQYSASVISGMIYRVPPHMLGMVDKDTSWGKGIEQQELGFVKSTLGIWLARWEDLLTSWLPPGQFVLFDLSKRLRGDTATRWAMYQIARVTGAMNNAEIRKAEGMPMPTDQTVVDLLENYQQPLNSAPMAPAPDSSTASGGAAGGSSAPPS